MISWVQNKEMRGNQKLRNNLAENQIRFNHQLNNITFMRIIVTIFLALVTTFLWAQKTDKPAEISADLFNALSFRSIGPAVTSGRVVDFAVNPSNPNEYFVAAACGGVWKTTNRGTTYSPVFDGQGSYSIGCVIIDPSNANIVWVGSGENNNQRSVAYGDGVYKSEDGGKTWKNKGLKLSEHIGRIAVDPTNSNIVYVAAYGPVWKEGEKEVFINQQMEEKPGHSLNL